MRTEANHCIRRARTHRRGAATLGALRPSATCAPTPRRVRAKARTAHGVRRRRKPAPEQFATMIKTEAERFAKIIKAANIKPVE
jgi:hypothetical protein